MPTMYNKVRGFMAAVLYWSKIQDTMVQKVFIQTLNYLGARFVFYTRTIISSNSVLQGIETKSEYSHRLSNRNAANNGVSRSTRQAGRGLH